MHLLYTFFYLAIFSAIWHKFKGFNLAYFVFLILIAIITNIPINQGLNINDFTYSILSKLSAFSFIISFVFIANKNSLFDYKTYAFVFVINLLFFLTYLNIIPIKLYYADISMGIICVCLLCIVAYFINIYLAFVYLLCLIIFVIHKDGNVFDYFFDVITLLITFFVSIICGIRKIISKNTRNKF